VESTGFAYPTFLDASGLPHSGEMITVKRIRKVSNNLEDIITIPSTGITRLHQRQIAAPI